MGTRRTFSREFKVEAVRLVVERRVSMAQKALTSRRRPHWQTGCPSTCPVIGGVALPMKMPHV
jgi:hypothetical protein